MNTQMVKENSKQYVYIPSALRNPWRRRMTMDGPPGNGQLHSTLPWFQSLLRFPFHGYSQNIIYYLNGIHSTGVCNNT